MLNIVYVSGTVLNALDRLIHDFLTTPHWSTEILSNLPHSTHLEAGARNPSLCYDVLGVKRINNLFSQVLHCFRVQCDRQEMIHNYTTLFIVILKYYKAPSLCPCGTISKMRSHVWHELWSQSVQSFAPNVH